MKFILFVLTTLISHSLLANYDLYVPTKAGTSPILIFVHGGAWISGGREDYKKMAQSLAQSEVCVVTAGYRLAPGAQHPLPVEDLDETIQRVSKLKEPKCDARRVFLVGHSAGAHMIAFWNTQFKSSSVKGFVGVEGIYDLPALSKRWPAYKDWFLDKAFGSEKGWEKASPANLPQVSKGPWLLIHSKKDELVDIGQTQSFERALRSQKIRVSVEMLKAESHFGAIEALSDAKSVTRNALRKFIRNN